MVLEYLDQVLETDKPPKPAPTMTESTWVDVVPLVVDMMES